MPIGDMEDGQEPTPATSGRTLYPYEVVCLMVGDGLADIYVDRLYRMLQRRSCRPFRLSCLTDRPRRFEEPIQEIEIQEGSEYRPTMRPTQHKLKLLSGGGWPFPEFLYLDVTLVVKSDLEPLWQWLESRAEPLATLKDWKWDTVNTCLMRVRRDDALARVHEDYAFGTAYNVRLKGDQDFIDASLRAHGLMDRVAFVPSQWVASYKDLRRKNRAFPRRAQAAYREACIVKFHGRPRPHELFEKGYWNEYLRGNPVRALRDRGYLVDEMAANWR